MKRKIRFEFIIIHFNSKNTDLKEPLFRDSKIDENNNILYSNKYILLYPKN